MALSSKITSICSIFSRSPAKSTYSKRSTRSKNGIASTTTALPFATFGGSAAFDGNHLYLLGGEIVTGTVPSFIPDVLHAAVVDDGSVGEWTANTALPAARALAGSLVVDGTFYLIGGGLGATSVYYTRR